MPCLRLTCAQAQRLFGMTPDGCQRILTGLVHDGTLARGGDERYRLAAESSWPPLTMLLRHMSPPHSKAS
jgi:hypothetical protein